MGRRLDGLAKTITNLAVIAWIVVLTIEISKGLVLEGTPLLDDLHSVRRSYGAHSEEANLKARQAVVRHIPLGTTEERVFDIVQDNGFKVYPVKGRKDISTHKHDWADFLATYKGWLFWPPLYQYEYRVGLYFEDFRLTEVKVWTFIDVPI